MRGDRSAYAVLGLQPDADLADIDRAYKRLIKLHHPDRHGGDVERAAQINRAYRELRGRPDPQDALILHEDDRANGSGRGWLNAAMVLVVALALLVLANGPVMALIRQLAPAPRLEAWKGSATARDPMDQPIRAAAITAGARAALGVMSRRDESSLLGLSRDCYRELRLDPTVEQLDRCAAFDDAVVQLQDRDPMSDGGPFSPVAVTGRQWSAAAALSNDYLAVDGRLDRIRLQVELALAPREQPSATAVQPQR